MEEVAQPPQWMLNLENKLKKPHRLAHEIGAGSPCIKCVDSCPGLDLHYWRKLCRNCKCKREDHDLADDAGSLQFDILLSKTNNAAGKLRHKKTVLDLDVPSDKKTRAEVKQGVTMDWVPPGVSVDLAAEYMKKLPSTKVPISGSAGALYRRQQFERQLPVHDLSPGLCHQLTPHEIDELNKYLSNIKTDVVGQGKVEKLSIITHHPSVYSTPLNNQSDQNIVQDLKKPYQFGENIAHSLKKPYQFDLKNANSIPKPFVPYAGTQAPSNTNTSPAGLSLNDPILLKTPSSFLNNNKFVKNLHSNINRVDDAPGLIEGKDSSMSNNNDESVPVSSNDSTFAQPDSEFLLPPYKGTHAAVRSPAKYLQHSEDQRSADSYCVPRALHQLKPDELNQFNNLKIDDAVGSAPVINDGDNQIQPVDVNVEQHVKLNCHSCQVEILQGEVVVSAERAGNSTYWHPQCFVCATCKELLVDLVYFYYKDDVYCGRHYAEKVSMLRCFACDELIFVKEYTMAEGKQFHIRHFCCFHCDTPLAGKEYIPMDNHPVCLDCYRTKYSKVCQTCEKVIEPVDKRVTIKDLNWHAIDACFCCQFCKKPLANSKMVIDSKKPFCNKQCALSK
ncbi:hypothetical protein LSTR_LSTR000621 [Laodelphax striatellus]|uniref:Testin n=1 Tax=Laodelphax striatellus TaxID=195883 RepID=A0A482XGQ1_LAOST|nr:hypothetical protein LSTR_LSTR000621 [Laodelphax striatellus]